MFSQLIHQIKEVPEYFIALKAGLAVLSMGIPIYAGLWYFLYRRKLKVSVAVTFNFVGAFVLFGGLAFLLASPLAGHIPAKLLTTYLFITCIWAGLGFVSLIDTFLVRHYLINVKRIYISPPLRTVIKVGVFLVVILPIFRFVLDFNPLALVAIPTIMTAAVALAFQDTFKAFIAGINLGHDIRIGEWIGFQDKQGKVLDLTWARTVIQMADGARVSIPNNLLQTGIYQVLPPGGFAIYRTLKVNAPFDAAPERVKEALLGALDGIKGLTAAPRAAWIVQYTESGILYSLLYALEDFMTADPKQDEVGTKVWHALHKAGISISYPTRTIQMEPVTKTNGKPSAKKSL